MSVAPLEARRTQKQKGSRNLPFAALVERRGERRLGLGLLLHRAEVPALTTTTTTTTTTTVPDAADAGGSHSASPLPSCRV